MPMHATHSKHHYIGGMSIPSRALEMPHVGSLVNIRDFQEIWRQSLYSHAAEKHMNTLLSLPPPLESAFSTIELPTFCEGNVDIDCSELKLSSPVDQIEEAISREVARDEIQDLFDGSSGTTVTQLLLLQSDIPTLQDLKDRDNIGDLECIKDLKRSKGVHQKRRRKEVNYVTHDVEELPAPRPGVEAAESDGELEPHDVILSVTLYHTGKPQKVQEFLMNGNQRLTDLKDSLYCVCDSVLDGPHIKSGFFFIEGVFYSDLREEDNEDYSEPIRKWQSERIAAGSAPDEPWTLAAMEDTTFSELALRPGAAYCYVHQGNCQHIVIFSDIRLKSKHDPALKRSYPAHTFQSKIRRKKCRICDIFPAKWVTYDDNRSHENPCFYCELCFRPFHYTYDGLPLNTDYRVFPYQHE